MSVAFPGWEYWEIFQWKVLSPCLTFSEVSSGNTWSEIIRNLFSPTNLMLSANRTQKYFILGLIERWKNCPQTVVTYYMLKVHTYCKDYSYALNEHRMSLWFIKHNAQKPLFKRFILFYQNFFEWTFLDYLFIPEFTLSKVLFWFFRCLNKNFRKPKIC